MKDENDKCHNCGIEGWSGPPHNPGDDILFTILEHKKWEEIPKGLAALFMFAHELYCYPCYCVCTNTCIHCGEVKDHITRDYRCKNDLYLCDECIKEPTCPHLYKCYKDGCMTIEEFAQHEYQMIQDGGPHYDEDDEIGFY